jgi:FHA domain
MTCQACGTILLEGSDRCSQCGVRVETSIGQTRMFVAQDILDTTRVYGAEKSDEPSNLPSKNRSEDTTPIFGWLVVMEGIDAWKVFTLPAKEAQFFLGTGKECIFRFDDTQLEERHASIRIKENDIYVTDMDTTAGTMVNGKAITRISLNDGDVIKASTIVLKFKRL